VISEDELVVYEEMACLLASSWFLTLPASEGALLRNHLRAGVEDILEALLKFTKTLQLTTGQSSRKGSQIQFRRIRYSSTVPDQGFSFASISRGPGFRVLKINAGLDPALDFCNVKAENIISF